jgi:hypothetical protein
VHTGAGQHRADRELPVRHVEMQLVTPPVLLMSLAAGLSADVAVNRPRPQLQEMTARFAPAVLPPNCLREIEMRS